ncbi:MFS transporter [Siculibacillus lacustris]|uniref:MFS transporter n=1 Tax=Siculibacillus lacustris TaxID=1549641 RepID=A0A4Q9VUJ9_9HYPH|nr:MFS transporter [Siculibacillus lacustris]TBW38708.1 MFS transporter [Siculibacillus lacustris]
MPLPLFALAVASFCIGTTEFVIMGLLPEIAADLHVSIPDAGQLVTGYALGVVIGAPILAVLTARMARKPVLVALTCLFVIGNLACALAPSYWLLMGARVLTAFGHGAFFGIGAVVAANLVAPNRRASAIALMFAGLTLSNILGVPAGTALGGVYGWRVAFFGVVGIGVASVAAVAIWVPRGLPGMAGGGLMREVRVLGQPQVWLGMAVTVVASASMFAVLTYIKPILTDVAGLPIASVTWTLLVFGVGTTLGNALGGRLADRHPMGTIIWTLVAIAVLLATFAITGHQPVAAIAAVALWGVLGFLLGSPLQMRVITAASAAPNLASTLNQGAFNLGNAGGAWIGGAALELGLTYDRLPLVGAALALAAAAIAAGSQVLDRRPPKPRPVSAAVG